MKFWQKHKWKIIVPVLIVLVLAAAWAGAYFLLGMHTRGRIWVFFLVMLLGSGGYSFCEWKKEK